MRPSLLRLSEATDSRKAASVRPASSIPETATCSHSMGTLSALKTVLTLSVTSPPIPSPGIRLTVYLPPNLAGLKMSDWTVAKPRAATGCWAAAQRRA